MALEDGLPAEAVAKEGMVQMSARFEEMGDQVYLDAENVKRGEQSGVVKRAGA
jgi:hypothetical protein